MALQYNRIGEELKMSQVLMVCHQHVLAATFKSQIGEKKNIPLPPGFEPQATVYNHQSFFLV